MNNISKLKKDIKLLDECIEHYKVDNLNKSSYKTIKIYSSTCSLCKVYNNGIIGSDRCIGCPVETESGGCEHTPWIELKQLFIVWRNENIKSASFDRFVRYEITYLRKLRNKLIVKLDLLLIESESE